MAERLAPFSNRDEEEAFLSWYGQVMEDRGWPRAPKNAPVDARAAFRTESSGEGDEGEDIIIEPRPKPTVDVPEGGFDFSASDTPEEGFDFSGIETAKDQIEPAKSAVTETKKPFHPGQILGRCH
jgi:hypothetical protein